MILNDDYYLSVYWDARLESCEKCAERLSLFLNCIESIDTLFTDWHLKGQSRQSATSRIAKNPNSVLLLLKQRRVYDDCGNPMPLLGHTIGLWNGRSGRAASSLSITCGSSTVSPNSCVLSLPQDMSKLDLDKLLLIGCSAFQAFDPEWGIVTSHALDNIVNAENGGRRCGWITMFSKLRHDIPIDAALVTQLGSFGWAICSGIVPPNVDDNKEMDHMRTMKQFLTKNRLI